MNLKSKFINLSEVARAIKIPVTTLHNRLNGVGRHKALTTKELENIKELIKKDTEL